MTITDLTIRRGAPAALAIALMAICAPSLSAQSPSPSSHLVLLRSSSDISAMTGLGIFRLDRQNNLLHYRITVADTADSLTQAHLIRPMIGDTVVIASLPVPAGKTTLEGSLAIASESMMKMLDSGSVVLNITSRNHPQTLGAGRVEVIPTAVTQEVSPEEQPHRVDSSYGEGRAYIVLDRAARRARYLVEWFDLTGPATGVQFHRGARREVGPVAHTIDISSGRSMLMGTWNDMSDEDIRALLENRMYLNILTEQYPAGEIRGSLFNLTVLTTEISHRQVVPPVSGTTANGTGYLAALLTGQQAFITSAVILGETTGTIESVHLHQDIPGGNDPALIPYEDSGNGIWQVDQERDLSSIPQSVIDEIRRGTIYTDFHTSTHPDGEARGMWIPAAATFTASAPAAGPQMEKNISLSAATSNGAIRFTIGGVMAGTDRKILLYSTLGARVAATTVRENHAEIGAASLPAGMYMAQLLIDGITAGSTPVMIVR